MATTTNNYTLDNIIPRCKYNSSSGLLLLTQSDPKGSTITEMKRIEALNLALRILSEIKVTSTEFDSMMGKLIGVR